jgi:hypothetical protein
LTVYVWIDQIIKGGKAMRIYPKDHKQAIIDAWTNDRLSLSKIAKQYKCSRQAIYKILKESNIDTSKATGCKVSVTCAWCFKEFSITRSRYHSRKKANYCSVECYTSYSNELGQGYKPNRQGQRIGRRIVERIYGPLPIGSIVHHIDKNNWNNTPYNLMLFDSQASHIYWHRGMVDKTVILWNGKDWNGIYKDEISYEIEYMI